MTLAEIDALVVQKLGDQNAFYPQDERLFDGIDPAQRLLCLAYPRLLSRRIVTTVNEDQPFLDLRTLQDTLGANVGNRIRRVTRVVLGDVSTDQPTPDALSNALTELRLVTIDSLEATNNWLDLHGEPTRYWLWRRYWLGLYKRPMQATTITVVFDATPLSLFHQGLDAIPDIQEAYHTVIAAVATGILLLKEGVPQGAQGVQHIMMALGMGGQ